MSGVSKVIFGDQTLIDLTTDTVTEKNLMRGYSAHSADGSPIKGLYNPGEFNVEHKNISQNGTYNASSDNVDGYSSIAVNVPKDGIFKEIDFEENGTYNASSYNADGFSIVGVEVDKSGTFVEKDISQNGTYSASSDSADGYSVVRVDVESHGEYTTTIDGVTQERDLSFISCYTEMPYYFTFGAAVVYNNVLHIIGGGPNRKSHYTYNAATSSWSRLNDLPYDFYNGDATVRTDMYDGSHDETKIDVCFYVPSIDIGYGTKSYILRYYWNSSGDSWSMYGYRTIDDIVDSRWCRSIAYSDQTHTWGLSNEFTAREYNGGHLLSYQVISNHGDFHGMAFSLDSGLFSGDAAFFNNRLHVICVPSTRHFAIFFNDMYEYTGVGFSDLSSLLPYDLQYTVWITMVSYNNLLHVFTHSHHYTFDGTAWELIEINPCNFLYSTAVVYNNDIHIIGCNPGIEYKGHYKWNPTNGWTRLGNFIGYCM